MSLIFIFIYFIHRTLFHPPHSVSKLSPPRLLLSLFFLDFSQIQSNYGGAVQSHERGRHWRSCGASLLSSSCGEEAVACGPSAAMTSRHQQPTARRRGSEPTRRGGSGAHLPPVEGRAGLIFKNVAVEAVRSLGCDATRTSEFDGLCFFPLSLFLPCFLFASTFDLVY